MLSNEVFTFFPNELQNFCRRRIPFLEIGGGGGGPGLNSLSFHTVNSRKFAFLSHLLLPEASLRLSVRKETVNDRRRQKDQPGSPKAPLEVRKRRKGPPPEENSKEDGSV